MARKKRPSKLRPKTPSRVKKRTRARKGARVHQHPELIGLGLAALGVFLGAVMYAGWNGGYVGRWRADGHHARVGDAAYGLPVALAAVGGLMLGRSALLDVRPFRTGLLVTGAGLPLVLGGAHGGYLGRALQAILGLAIGSTGRTVLGVLFLLAGGLLLSGASAGAWIRGPRLAPRESGEPSRRPVA